MSFITQYINLTNYSIYQKYLLTKHQYLIFQIHEKMKL